jgi:cytochrome c oxidase subunit II
LAWADPGKVRGAIAVVAGDARPALETPTSWLESAALRPDVTAAHSSRRRSRRASLRVLALAVAVGALVSLVLAPAAMANFITPKAGGSKNANEIASLYKIILYMAAVVFVIVEGALAYSVIKFRAKRGARAAQIHGNTRLEISWTVAAAVILVVLTVITFVKLPNIINPPPSNPGVVLSAATTQPTVPKGTKLTICIQGRQFIWRYTYGNGCLNNAYAGKLPYSFTEMEVPAGVTVVLDIQANDVIHSWWIPSLGGKVDAVPGYTTYTWFKADKVGALYHGQCAQLCGRGHAAMVATVRVLSPSDYEAWIARQERLIQQANAQVTQLRQQLTSNGNL